MRWVIIIFLILAIFSSNYVSATLGISPSIRSYAFEPGKEISTVYTIIGDNPDQNIEIYAEGDLAEYVDFDKDKITGPGRFIATIKFPDVIDKPGSHTIYIGVREVPPENEFLGTAINIRSIVDVFVPYPGKYLEASLNIPDANIGDMIPVELRVINRGKEDLYVEPYIDFYRGNKDEKVQTFAFNPVNLNSTQEKYFRRYLNASGFRPANYLAEAVISYSGDILNVNKTFRMGSLFINVTNFTEKLPKKGIQKYYVGIESRWNNPVDEVYADVNISNNVQNVSFRTPSVRLGPWESKALEGFVDTDELEGKYDVQIVLRYVGQETFAYGTLLVRAVNYLMIVVIAGAIALAILVVIVIWLIRRNRKVNKKSNARQNVKQG